MTSTWIHDAADRATSGPWNGICGAGSETSGRARSDLLIAPRTANSARGSPPTQTDTELGHAEPVGDGTAGSADATSPATIVDYDPSLRSAFRHLNLEWLERWFSVEPVDEEVLGDPERYVLAEGGHILFAVVAGEAVGTVALRAEGDGVYELTKMAVTPQLRGRGIGRQLVDAAIERFLTIGGDRLFLESNHRLEAAVSLYESAGFVHRSPSDTSAYGRADVFMEWQPRTP